MEKAIKLLEKILGKYSTQDGLDDLLFMSKNCDGYKRENAVRRLGMLGNPIAIPNLIKRLNDWVPQVRNAAKEAILRLAIPSNATAFIFSLPEFYHLINCERDDHTVFVNLIEDYLTDLELRKLVISGISNEDSKIARCCFLPSISRSLLGVNEILETGLVHRDIIIRVKASHYLRKTHGPYKKIALDIALTDKFMPIRRDALRILIEDNVSTEFLKYYLFDRHTAIRKIAINILITNSVDVAAIYIGFLSDKTLFKLRCAIWGIGHLQARSYLDKVIPLLESKHPTIRKQSLSCLSKLKGDDFNSNIIKFLSDDSPIVRKEAFRLTVNNSILFSVEHIRSIYQNSKFDHTKLICFEMLPRLNKWDSLSFIFWLLSSCKDQKPVQRARINTALSRWNFNFNKSFIQPSEDQIYELRKQCEKLQDNNILDEYVGIIFTLKTIGVLE